MSVSRNRAFLLTWNPKLYDWATLDEDIETIEAGDRLETSWSVRRKDLPAGSRVYLLKQGDESRGLIASGLAITDASPDERNPSRSWVRVEFDRLLRRPVSVEQLLELSKTLSQVHWSPQQSGTEVPEALVSDLEWAWTELAGAAGRSADVSPRKPTKKKSAPVRQETRRRKVATLRAEGDVAMFTNDRSEGTDLLGVTNDASAFARLITSVEVQPPLSIGIFGNWGAGKSFFMETVQEQIGVVTDRAKNDVRPQGELAHFRHIRQITFNAWHYQGGELWASLVARIFEGLCEGEPDGDQLEATRELINKELYLAKLGQKEAKDKKSKAELELQDAESTLEKARADVDAKQDELAGVSVRDVLSTVAIPDELMDKARSLSSDLGLDPVSEGVREIRRAIEEGRNAVGGLGALLTPLIHAKDPWKRIAWLVLIVVGTPVTGWLVSLIVVEGGGTDVWERITWVVTSSLAGVSAVAGWIRSQAAWVKKWTSKASDVNAKLDEIVEERQRLADAELTELVQEVDRLRAQAESAAADEENKRVAVAKLTEKIDRLTPVRMLSDFIRSKAASDDYRGRLGIFANIRADFHKLSELIERNNSAVLSAKSDSEHVDETLVNRVILYIDDLDRCDAETVVSVLQAIHLLLAFPLFVVVVAVDARWMSAALKQHYPGLLVSSGGGAAAEPKDYLEKIFQVPFWIDGVETAGARQMTRELLRDKLDPDVLRGKTDPIVPIGALSHERALPSRRARSRSATSSHRSSPGVRGPSNGS